MSASMTPLTALLLALSLPLARTDDPLQLVCETDVPVGDGKFTITLRPDWAPTGVQRVLDMQKKGFFAGLPFFRVLTNFLIQFGISPDPEQQAYWRQLGSIQDDEPQGVAFADGIVSFAGYSKDSRSTHLFITLGDQTSGLGKRPWEVAIGQVSAGREVVAAIYSGYAGQLDQGRMQGPGAAEYLAGYPKLSHIKGCSTLGGSAAALASAREGAALALEDEPDVDVGLALPVTDGDEARDDDPLEDADEWEADEGDGWDEEGDGEHEGPAFPEDDMQDEDPVEVDEDPPGAI